MLQGALEPRSMSVPHRRPVARSSPASIESALLRSVLLVVVALMFVQVVLPALLSLAAAPYNS